MSRRCSRKRCRRSASREASGACSRAIRRSRSGSRRCGRWRCDRARKLTSPPLAAVAYERSTPTLVLDSPSHKLITHHLLRLLQEIPLHEVHAAREEDRHAGGVLDELRHGDLLERARLAADLAHLLLVFLVARQLGHEGAVDLEVLGVDVLEQLEGIEAVAELLERER